MAKKPPKFPALYRNKQDKSKKPGQPKYDTKVDPDIQLSLRYRIPQKLMNIPEETRKKMVNWLAEQQRSGNDQRTQFIEKIANYRAAWQNFDNSMVVPGYEGGSNIHVPLTFEKVRALHARVYQAILGMDPMFTIRPRNAVQEELKVTREQLLQWITSDYSNYQRGWKETLDQDIWNFIADGTAITKHSWMKDVRKYVGVDVREKRPLELDADGRPVLEEEEIEKEEVRYDGPMLETVRLEDFTIVGNYSDNVDEADLVVHRQKFTRSEIIKLAKQGFFESEAAKKVCELAPDNNSYQMATINGNSNLLKDQQDSFSGINQNFPDTGIQTYVINESYFRFDIDGDGIDEELVAWVEESTNCVLRLTYLDRVGPGGKRPFVIKKFLPRQSSYYGIGLGEMLYGLNSEMDMLHNMSIDNGVLINLPMYAYRASSGINPQNFNAGPGKMIPVDDVNDIKPLQTGGGTNYFFQQTAEVSSNADKAVGVNDITVGSTEGQGAARTATGASILANASNSGIDVFIQRYQEGFKKNLHIMDLQCAALLPLGLQIRVTGQDGKDLYRQFENRESLDFECDYCLEGNTSNSNKMLERDVSLQLLQLASNPLYLQTGIVSPKNIYNLLRRVYQAYDIKNIASFATQPQDAQGNPYSAKDELSAILAGVRLPKDVMDKHEEKLMFFQQFEDSDDFGLLDAEHLPLYKEYKQWHEQMAQAMMANANNPLTQNQLNPAPELAAQIAAGGAPMGVLGQMSDLISPNSALAEGTAPTGGE